MRRALRWQGQSGNERWYISSSGCQLSLYSPAVHGTDVLCLDCRPSSRTFKTVFKAVRPSVAMF